MLLYSPWSNGILSPNESLAARSRCVATWAVKSVLHFEPVFTAQMLTYLRITNIRTGLILNFNRPVLREGIKRFVL